MISLKKLETMNRLINFFSSKREKLDPDYGYKTGTECGLQLIGLIYLALMDLDKWN